MPNDDDDFQVIDPDDETSYGYSREQKINFQNIVMNQIQKIADLASREMRESITQKRVKRIGGTIYEEKTIIEDIRETFSNSVDTLCDICFYYFDNEMLEIEEEANRILDKLKINSLKEDKFKQKIFDEDKFKNEKVKVKRKLFRELCSFIARQKYFAQEGVTITAK